MDKTALDDYSLRVAAILRKQYEISGLTYAQITKATGLSGSTVNRVINGKRHATAFYLHKLCEVLSLSPGEVLDAADNVG